MAYKKVGWPAPLLPSCCWGSILLFSGAYCFASVSIDVAALGNLSATATQVSTPTFSSSSVDELLRAVFTSDGATATSKPSMIVTYVSGEGPILVAVARANTQFGDAETWRGFAPNAVVQITVATNMAQTVFDSIKVVSFSCVYATAVDGSGAIRFLVTAAAAKGEHSAGLTTTRFNSLVFGVGNDWGKAVARTAPSDQLRVQQFLSESGDAYWVQQHNAPSVSVGASLTISDVLQQRTNSTWPSAARQHHSLGFPAPYRITAYSPWLVLPVGLAVICQRRFLASGLN